MATIYWSYRPRTHVDGSGAVECDDADLDPTSRQVLKGMAQHIADVLAHAWEAFEMAPGDFDGLDILLRETFDRTSKPEGAIRQMTDETGASAFAVLRDLIAVSALLSKLSIDALENCDYESAVSRHSLSVSILARASILLDLGEASSGNPATGPAHALSFRADQVVKPDFVAFVRRVIASGDHKEIKTINDLLDTPGYNHKVCTIAPTTLKKWAREEGMTFQRGRPKKQI